MKLQPFKTLALLILLFGAAPWVYAEDDKADIENYYQSGVKAFNAKDFGIALGYFRQAQLAGDESAQVQYNIAVSLYRLDIFDEAKEVFLTLVEEAELGWWAQYNLALINQQQSFKEEAAQGFLRVANSASDVQLAALAQKKYAELVGIPQRPDRSGNHGWLGNIGMSLGYDDNVIDPQDTSGSDAGDQYYETMLMVSNTWGDQGAVTWRLDGLGYTARYWDVDEYDVNLANLGITSVFDLANWVISAGVDGEYSMVGDEGFLRNLSLKFSGRYTLHEQGLLKLAYKFTDYNSLSTQYDQLSGEGHRMDVEYVWTNGEVFRWQLRYRVAVEDRADFEDTDTFSSYSPIRNELRLRGIWRPGSWEYAVSLSYRDSQYQDSNQFSDTSFEKRHDKRMRAAVTALYQWSESWSANMELNYTDNDSSISDFSYDRSNVMGGVSWSF